MNEQQKIEQERVLEIGSGLDCYWFARFVEGADIPALQARVLEIGDAWDCSLFAGDIKGADKDALQARIKELKESKMKKLIKPVLVIAFVLATYQPFMEFVAKHSQDATITKQEPYTRPQAQTEGFYMLTDTERSLSLRNAAGAVSAQDLVFLNKECDTGVSFINHWDAHSVACTFHKLGVRKVRYVYTCSYVALTNNCAFIRKEKEAEDIPL